MGSKNTPSSFALQKPGYRLQPGGPVGLYVGFAYLPVSVMLWVPRHVLVLIS